MPSFTADLLHVVLVIVIVVLVFVCGIAVGEDIERRRKEGP